MNKGLYASPGISATASAAACARRLASPITNCSNVRRGWKSSPVKAGVARCLEGAGGVAPAARIWIRVPDPSTAAVHAASRRAKLASTHARLSAGASITSVRSSNRVAASGSSHRCHVESLTARRISARMRRQACGNSTSGTSARKSLPRRGTWVGRWTRGASRRPGRANIAKLGRPGRGPPDVLRKSRGVRSEGPVDGCRRRVRNPVRTARSAARYPVAPLPAARVGSLAGRP
jgi:hypothetical protein